MPYEIVGEIESEGPYGPPKKLTLNLAPRLYERFLADHVTGKRTQTAALIRAIGSQLRVDELQQQDLEVGGDGFVYLAPADDPTRPVNMFPPY